MNPMPAVVRDKPNWEVSMKALTIVLALAFLASAAFGVDIGGSTAVAGIGNGDQQRLEADQDIDLDIGALHFDLAGGVDHNLVGRDIFWDYDLAANYTLGIFKFGGGVTGNQGVKLDAVKAFVDLAYEKIGADFDILFSADAAKDVFQGLDVSAFYANDWLHVRVGWLFTENGAPDINAPELLTDGGVYAKVKVSY